MAQSQKGISAYSEQGPLGGSEETQLQNRERVLKRKTTRKGVAHNRRGFLPRMGRIGRIFAKKYKEKKRQILRRRSEGKKAEKSRARVIYLLARFLTGAPCITISWIEGSLKAHKTLRLMRRKEGVFFRGKQRCRPLCDKGGGIALHRTNRVG